VISEAIVAGTPVIASRIAGNVGLLGEDYPGYFDVGGTRELASLLERVESDAEFLDELRSRCERLAANFDLARERLAWADLLRELAAKLTT
jgi:glycosyltransferase involved in cell wall biosynthesis